MKTHIPEIPIIPETLVLDPTVNRLVETLQLALRKIKELVEENALLKDEIAKLKGQKPRPKLPHSKTADDAKNKTSSQNSGMHRSITRRPRKKELKTILPENIPQGSIFKGYELYNVQDIRIESVEIQLRLAVYLTPEGTRIRGEPPSEYQQGHFGAELITYCLSQYYQCHVTEPLLLQHLYEMGIDISAAQLSNILIQDKESFHQEKEEVLKAGLKHSKFINADDTGARHDGKNGYCTAIGSPLFSYFQSTDSKSRINFLKILQGNQELYVLTEEALDYVFDQNLREEAQEALEKNKNRCFNGREAWEKFLKKQKIESKQEQRMVTEGALLGGALKNGVNKDLLLISDAAKQFAIFQNGLCWVHEERHYRKLIPLSSAEETEIARARSDIWDFYEDLKGYKVNPTILQQKELAELFDQIFSKTYVSIVLNSLLKNTRSRKEGLLLVLKYPFLPLHNNDSERDIREYVKRRKISGSTRSVFGRRARDTFTSLKKTCLKLGISFYGYLKDRVAKTNQIPPLKDLIARKVEFLTAVP
jgi:regulator of replication initiation timing